MTSDNVSPMNLIYVRKVGYGVRKTEDIFKTSRVEETLSVNSIEDPKVCEPDNIEFLQSILKKVIEELK